MYVVVIRELPRHRNTLLLRLMGRRKTLRDALDDLQSMPEEAFERRLAMPLVLRWAREMGDAKNHALAQFEKEALMNAQQWLEQELEQERNKGIKQGLQPVLHLYQRRLGRALREEEKQQLLSRFERLGPEGLADAVLDLDPVALEQWLKES